jgi:transcriptional regulator with XRE-family HTH domain
MKDLGVARKIRQMRLQNKLTLDKVAEQTGFTKSYLSMVETGKKSPPIATLSKIAQALSVDIADFFEQKKPKDRITVVRKEERKVVVRDEAAFGYRYESIAPAKTPRRMEPFIVTHLPNDKGGNWFDHEGEELFFVLEGEINLFYGDMKYLLREGDCAHFDSSIPHRAEGIGKKTVKTLVVINSAP